MPFLNPEWLVPDRLRQHGAQGKWLLKKAMERILPHDVIYRPKPGFGVSLRAWLRGPLKGMLGGLLSTDTLRARGLFDPAAVSRLVAENEVVMPTMPTVFLA